MGFTQGSRLGTYEVLGAIGAGGMGEVYRARDTKLGRDVALKILPEAFANDPERLGRFRREAQVLAALNHVNIAAIYGFEDQSAAMSESRMALVLELVEGPTLAERIAEGPIPFAQALAIVRQIAAALESAHEQGIIHRDLKPANVKVKDDGTVKVLDFGLAKALATDTDPSASSVSNSPTLTARATQLGTILGTAAYMAPEQAKGRALDRRADIWAFGVVLFEMLTGGRAFEGDDVSDVLASVLKSEPEWSKLPADVPAPARRLLRRCLEKDPKRRLRDVSEGMVQFDDAMAAGDAASSIASAPGVASAGTSRPWWRGALTIAAAVALTAIVTAVISRQLTPAPPPAAPVRFQFLPPAQDGLYISAQGTDIALSNDGQTMAFTSLPSVGSIPHLRVHRLSEPDSTVLAGGDMGYAPFFSPEGRWIGFVSSTDGLRLDKVPVSGGTRTLLTETKVPVAGATWLEDGSVVFGLRVGGLRRIPPAGGEPTELTKLDPALKETAHRWPAAIPGTSLVLFSYDPVAGSTNSALVAVVDVKSGKITRLNIKSPSAKYAAGHLVFAAVDGTLRAQPFDVDRLAPTGDVAVILEGLRVKSNGASNFDVSSTGTVIHTPGSGTAVERTLTWVERGGKETPIGAPTRNYYYARVSPKNSTRLSLDIRDQSQDVWVWEPRGTLARLTVDDQPDQYGIWTPDGQRIIFQSSRQQKRGIYIVRADGASAPELLAEHDGVPNAVTPDGKGVILRGGAPQNDLFLLSIADHTVKTLLATERDELNAEPSPDGRWMAYQSDLSGQMEVWVRPFPKVNDGQTLISTRGGTKPAWSPDGREIYYLSADSKIMSVPVSPVGALSPGTPTLVFDAAPYFFGGVGRNYDIAPDGKRFVMVKNPANVGADPIAVWVNWIATLKK